MRRSRVIRLLAFLVVLVLSAGCDQATKHLARRGLGGAGSVTLPGAFVQLTLAENPGAFLSLGAALPQEARTALTMTLGAGLALLLVYLLRARRLGRVCFIGLTLVFAGGASNLMDRVFHHGLVTDFIVFRVGPLHTGIFNLADIAVTLGALMLALSLHAGTGRRELPPAEKGVSQ